MKLNRMIANLLTLLVMLAAFCNAGSKVKKLVIHVPLHIKKVHHTHTVYQVIKEAHHKNHGGQAADHASHHHSWH
ncbi:hypothetical protein L798_02768 [Zootermopsis nevadensis]|uniref:Histidine-rich glycoprotein n=1 Tax=Zootermopsis nevadensis TaxID=136037 RepID=A0A067RCY0_ZOONE|nr:hypothetical protein L798_02768 [Zootermopsis nevadensis]